MTPDPPLPPPPGDPRACLRAVVAGADLGAAEAEALFATIMDGAVSPVVIAALLAALATKGETVGEITAAARVMRARAAPFATARGPLLDTCGTGGDGSGSFNVSTAAGLVAAAAGLPVAKHGNRAASSRAGSADVLEALGVAIDLAPEDAGRCLDEVGFAFLFAPRFHPATRHAVPARREIGIRTIFNWLGPLTNPAGARRQVVGVARAGMVLPMAGALAALGAERALVVHGAEGLDEISVAGPTIAAEVLEGRVVPRAIAPADLGLPTHPAGALLGGDPAENAAILRAVLEGEGAGGSGGTAAARSDVVAANAGAAIWIGGGAASLGEGVERARAVLAEGSAAGVLEALAAASRRLAGDAAGPPGEESLSDTSGAPRSPRPGS